MYILVFIPIETLVPTYGILDFEFTWTPDRAETILAVWGAQGIFQETLAIFWDFLFIVGYVSLTFGLIVLVLRRSENKLQTIGLFMTITPFLTGIFDIIENINLIVMLSNPTSILPVNPLMASISALLKFGFLFAAIIYFVIALIIVLINKIKKKNK
ncbi:MAG: hypothetical protein ACFFDN_19320 [Candidatus Hodarchaeota archaeon]